MKRLKHTISLSKPFRYEYMVYELGLGKKNIRSWEHLIRYVSTRPDSFENYIRILESMYKEVIKQIQRLKDGKHVDIFNISKFYVLSKNPFIKLYRKSTKSLRELTFDRDFRDHWLSIFTDIKVQLQAAIYNIALVESYEELRRL